jgi:oligopeptide transport system substrate-binding protein
VFALLAGCRQEGGNEETQTGGEQATQAGTQPPGTEGPAATVGEPAPPVGPTLRLAVGPNVRTLDPAAATDPAEGSILTGLFDPLVKLGADGQAVPWLARRWEVSQDGKVVTFHLRSDGVWTNGDPVTAADFEYAWKRAAAPRFAKRNARLLWDIKGAQRYTSCDPDSEDCAALQEEIAVEALDDVTLEVTLKEPMPWFPQEVAHWAFLPVHEPTIARFKRRWTLPENIVSNGPFRLVEWNQGSALVLERWDEWRDAGSVDLARVEASMTSDPASAYVEFADGRVDACLPQQCLPQTGLRGLASAPELRTFPAPVTTYLGVNTNRISEPGQRRAIAIGLDRRALAAKTASGEAVPATTLAPAGLPGFGANEDRYLRPEPRRGRARRLLRWAEEPTRELVLAYTADEEGLAELVQLQLRKLGLDVRLAEREPGNVRGADLYLGTARAESLDAISVLAQWTCDSDANASGFCDPAYDRLARRARRTADADERYRLENDLEAALTGRKGAFPAIPLSWSSYDAFRAPDVGGFDANLLAVVDLPAVSLPDD